VGLVLVRGIDLLIKAENDWLNGQAQVAMQRYFNPFSRYKIDTKKVTAETVQALFALQ